MSNPSTKPTPSVTVATLNNEADYHAAFSELGKTIIDNFPNEAARPVLTEMYTALAILSCRIIGREEEANRLAKAAELVKDYDEHLATVGYEARVEENLLVIGPIMVDAATNFHRLNPEGTVCVACGKPIGAISELVGECVP